MKKTNAKHRHAARRKKPLRAEVKARRQAAQEQELERQLERRRKMDAEAEAEYQTARAAFAAAVARDQLATVPTFDREWWTSFGMDFFGFGEAGEANGVTYETHEAHAFEWVRLVSGPHRVVLAIDSRAVYNEDADEAELLLYATAPEALTAIQERAGYPDLDWIAPPEPTDNESGDGDPFGPPETPIRVRCLHCGDVYMSDEMKHEERKFSPGARLWYCRNPDCDGAGFGFDILDADAMDADEMDN
jgi:hypothetical protein